MPPPPVKKSRPSRTKFPARMCPACGSLLIPNRAWHKYCNYRCRMQHWVLRKGVEAILRMVPGVVLPSPSLPTEELGALAELLPPIGEVRCQDE